jgi:hypothetical protein
MRRVRFSGGRQDGATVRPMGEPPSVLVVDWSGGCYVLRDAAIRLGGADAGLTGGALVPVPGVQLVQVSSVQR